MSTWYDMTPAAEIVESGNRVFVQGACATPTPLIEAIVARGESLLDVEFTHLHTYGSVPYTDEHWRGHFSLRALFVGENVREAANAGRASYTPVFLSDVPSLFEPEGPLPMVKLAALVTSPS